MGKPKRGVKRKYVSVLGSDDEALYRDQEADPKSRAFMYNEIDEFNQNREKIPLDSDEDEEEFHSQGKLKEEVLGLPDSSDDDDDDDEDERFHSSMVQKDDMASDIDDEDDSLPNDQAWGKRKSSYYSTDYVDPDYGGFEGSDGEMAEAEEKEALKIQKRLLQQLKEEDFGLDWLDPSEKGSSPLEADKEKDRVSVDLSSLTDDQKLELLKKESPELLCVIEDFKTRMTELNDKILPLLPLVEDGTIPEGPGADYLVTKNKLILLYCTNISFYMMMRCRDVNVKHHPVLKRLLTFRKLLEQLKNVEEMLEPEIQALLRMLQEGKQVRPFNQAGDRQNREIQNANERLNSKLKKKNKKKVKFLEGTKASKKKTKKASMETADEKEALEMYNLMKQKNKEKLERNNSSDEESVEEEQDNSGTNDPEMPAEKRGINYQIAKNKGLTPHRKKEYRNPRVRHRVKFQKAKVRRKGQFKEPRTELQRYGGEVSGIRIGTKRGIKLK